MFKSKWQKGALLAAVLCGLPVNAGAADPTSSDSITQQEMLEELRALRAEVKDLRQQQQEQKEQFTAKQVDDTVSAITADAERRSQFFAETPGLPTAGYNNGFFIQSDNGDFSLKTNFIFQVRNVTTWREDGKNGGTDDDIQHGWEIRRAKLVFAGNVFGKDITYKLQLANQRNGSPIDLDDAWIGYAINKNWGVRVGQMKAPFNHEELTSDTDQLAVERSMINEMLGGGAVGPRVQGIEALYKNDTDKLRGEFMFGDGDQSINTDFRDNVAAAGTATSFPVSDTRSRWGTTGRLEYLFFGDWNAYKDFSARGNKNDLLVLGGGIDFTQGPTFGNTFRGTVDAQWENTKGLGLYAAYLCMYADDLPAAQSTRFDQGFLLQAGYSINPKWEVFGRYDIVFQDQDSVTGQDTYQEMGVGVTRFLGQNGNAGHKAQIVFDINYLPAGVPSNQTGLGYLANGGQNEVVLRLQFQLAI